MTYSGICWQNTSASFIYSFGCHFAVWQCPIVAIVVVGQFDTNNRLNESVAIIYRIQSTKYYIVNEFLHSG